MDAPSGAALVEVAAAALDTARTCEIDLFDINPRAADVLTLEPEEAENTVVEFTARCHIRGALQPLDSVPARLIVSAYDTAFAVYLEDVLDKNAVSFGRAGPGLENAVGFFGGATEDSEYVVFFEQD